MTDSWSPRKKKPFVEEDERKRKKNVTKIVKKFSRL